ncbi:hypothetical protein O181_011162 [Austropuccinia psidii MF-1]|uniref:DDE Tnp4 domain-containing protein n=1 Tax=Austropuccinia psidii MF-1 TaxID=1389203 RepID=A0A9Q3GLV6_9BASI|nr:hypothetical protein [Austropuccinia psidii MF-1]
MFPGMQDNDFKQVVQTTQDGFLYIYNLIQNRKLFKNQSNCPQLDVCLQLALTLEQLGFNGNGASLGWIARSYGISQGAVVSSSQKVIEVIFALQPQLVRWPKEAGQIEIGTGMGLEGFPGCIGFLDGKTIPLLQTPGLDGEVYYDHKKRYSLNVQNVCENFERITALLSGWPGSCADSTIYKRMGLNLRPCNFFSPGQYLLTNSAYPLSLQCIPCYKGAASESRYNRSFNYYLSQSQV